MLKRTNFSYDGRTYEIRAATIDDEVKVRLFAEDKLASPVFYTVPVDTAFDAKVRAFSFDLVEELMALMERDTISGRLRLFKQPGSRLLQAG
jgi:hypothetical protein